MRAAGINQDDSYGGSADVARRVKAILAGSSGNLVEWYDFYVYSAFALYFAKSFFPEGDQTAQLLGAAGIFAAGFLMRPIGAWLFGRIADRRGRRLALTASILLMCAGSALIALTPVYATIGIGAPVLLLTARLIQGLSLGGEYGTSATYLSEMATADRRGFYSSFQYVTLIGGQLSAMLVLLILQKWLLTQAQLESWGWRIPFGIGAVLSVVVFRLRRDMHETASFTQNKNRDGSLRALLKFPRQVALVFGLTLGGSIAFYTYTAYMQKFLVNTVGLPKDTVTVISVAALFLFMVLQPIAGALSDRIGRRPVMMFFGAAGTVLTVPMMTALQSARDPWMAFVLVMGALFVLTGYTAVNAIVKAELFPVQVRALGVGFPYAMTQALFGGSAEYVALWLKQAGVEHYFYWYVTGAIFISFVVYTFMPESRDTSAIEAQ